MNRARTIEVGGRRTRSALVVLALGGAITWWWATQGPWHAEPRVPAGDGSRGREVQVGKSEFVARLARQRSEAATNKLVVSYLGWAEERGTEQARRDILDALLQIETFPHGLKSVLSAVAGDPNPPEADPLWDHAVAGVAMIAIEHHVRISDVRDLMLLESRPRARRLLATALAHAARAELASLLDPEQRHALASDLIDIAFEPDSEPFRSELHAGIEALAGRDVGLLLRDGIEGVNWNEIDTFVRSEQAVDQALRAKPDARDQP